MAMSRPPMIDDDGTGTTGTVLNNAWYQAFCDAIDALVAPMGTWTNLTPVLTTLGGGSVTLTTNTTCRYTVSNKTLILTFYLTVTITGTPAGIQLAFPAGLTASHQTQVGSGASTTYLPNPLYLGTSATAPVLNIFRDINGTAFTAGSHTISGTATISLT